MFLASREVQEVPMLYILILYAVCAIYSSLAGHSQMHQYTRCSVYYRKAFCGSFLKFCVLFKCLIPVFGAAWRVLLLPAASRLMLTVHGRSFCPVWMWTKIFYRLCAENPLKKQKSLKELEMPLLSISCLHLLFFLLFYYFCFSVVSLQSQSWVISHSEQRMLHIALSLFLWLSSNQKIHLKNVIEASVFPIWVTVEQTSLLYKGFFMAIFVGKVQFRKKSRHF